MDQALVNDIIQWDIDNWSKALPFWEEKIDFNKHKKALALGEREGGLSLWLALLGIDVMCTDYHKFPETPLPLHKKHAITDQIKYGQENALNLSFKANSFDIIVFKSMIGALENPSNQKKAFDEAYRVLKPGGILIFAENIKATQAHQYARKKFTSWGNRWYYPTIKDLQKYSFNFESFQYQTTGLLSPFGRSEKQRKVLSKLDHFFCTVTPNEWKYILFGVARK
ncbi:MAG: class I SAM-dependent methyltransferase [Flavobacteriales bacterium]|jgi:SAM-dependent methyltransferase|nr:class I SAM-dependent methyltransferase [Flavobacteriales bacterium]